MKTVLEETGKRQRPDWLNHLDMTTHGRVVAIMLGAGIFGFGTLLVVK